MSFSASADITGEEVYLHFDQTVTQYDIMANASLRLTAGDDPDLRRIAVYKAPMVLGKSKSSLTGNSDVYIDGAVYLPKDDFLLSGNTQVHSVKAKLSVVAFGVELQGNVYFEIAPDPDFQAQGSFGAITAVRLLPY